MPCPTRQFEHDMFPRMAMYALTVLPIETFVVRVEVVEIGRPTGRIFNSSMPTQVRKRLGSVLGDPALHYPSSVHATSQTRHS